MSSERPKKGLLAALREEPLAFWAFDGLAELTCPCCEEHPSHISAYPFHSTPVFARQILTWCDTCGFGMVPGTSFELDDYYRSQYALENRQDRDMDPAAYFKLLNSNAPPGNLARYIGRARDQAKRIRNVMPGAQSMLDVGAGPGYALYACNFGAKFAIEQDRHSRKFLDFIGATLLEWNEVRGLSFDVVLLSHSLEHFAHDQMFDRLKCLVDALAPGGLLYVEVPPGGLSWKHYSYRHEPHTLFFTPESLDRLARRLNLEVLHCGPLISTFNLIEDRADPIYSPAEEKFGDPRGRLTLLGRKLV